MALDEYRRKRDFRRTGEPAGAAHERRRGPLEFVVQRHEARKLHYDLRLEWEGVLKSWAVPKGLVPLAGLRRLAVQTEDHPLEYARFEGAIPAGEYGAGLMRIWDRGHWEPLNDPADGLERGRLSFRLHGDFLRGEWSLVRTSRAGGDWLLIYRRSGEGALSGIPAADFSPQLATLTKDPPVGNGWVHETKFDGYRALVFLERGGLQPVRIMTRGGHDWTGRVVSLVPELHRIAAESAVIDGEIVILRADGTTDFQALQNAFREGADRSFHFFAFDLLFLNGEDLRDRPLIRRKELLKNLLGALPVNAGSVRYSSHVEADGGKVFSEACRLRLEGIISKKADAPYAGARAASWLKLKCTNRQEFVITGFTAPAGGRSGFGALLLGAHIDGRLVYCGKVGAGFTEASLREIRQRMSALVTPDPPFDPPVSGDITWLRPELVAEVEFAGWTEDGRLRHPVFKGLRDDKPARTAELEVTGRPSPPPVRLTHPERVLYPEQGITKRELAEYYTAIAGHMLPHLRDRPLMLLRCPAGAGSGCFYQKHPGPGAPPAIRFVEVERRRDGAARSHLMIRDLEGLLGLVQLGALEIHAWGSRAPRIGSPDLLVFDLDPGTGVEWNEVIEAAFEIRDVLEALGLRSFVKTTGGKGLHVVVPVMPEADWREVKAYTQALAGLMVRRLPGRFVSTLSKEKRQGKIFIDYLRNSQGATSVAPFSTRNAAGAPVALPVAWSELKGIRRPDEFTVRNVIERLRRDPDPWEGFHQLKQRLQLPRRLSESA